MRRRTVVLLVAATATVTWALPAVGASTLTTAKQAAKLAKKADRRAKSARKTADQANSRGLRALQAIESADGVPRAARAATAGRADSAASADVAATAARATVAESVEQGKLASATRYPVTGFDNDAADAEDEANEIALGRVGPVYFYGKCFEDSDADTVFGRVRARFDITGIAAPPSFPGQGGKGREVATGTAAANVMSTGPAGGFSWLLPDGTYHAVAFLYGSKNGNPANGQGIFGDGDGCVFSPIAVQQ